MKIASGFLAAALFWGLLGGEAHRKTERGNRLYEQSEWTGAMGSYADAQGAAPQAPELHYDVGNVLYRQEDWAAAAEAYGRALAAAPPDLGGRVAFNLGNALYKDGKFEDAVQAYRRALRAAPGDAGAKRNLELALQALQEEKKQDNQSKPKPDENGKKDPGKKDQSQENDPKNGEKPKDGQDRQKQPAPQPGSMSPEQARQLLDRLSDQERDNVKREAARRAQAVPSQAPEKNW